MVPYADARSRSRRSLARPRFDRQTSCTASSRRLGRISCGSPTSRTWRPGRASSTSRSSSTCSRVASSAGEYRARCEAISHSTPSSKRCTRNDKLVHHSDRGAQYVSIRYTERLADAGIERSVGSVGDSYDNALAETVIGLFKTEVIRRRGPWRGIEAVEFATLEWVDWFNHRRLFEPIGNIPPAEAEARYYAQIAGQAMAA